MTSKRWDLAISHKSKDGKWRSTKIGVIFEGDKGQLQVKIDPGVSVSTPEGVMLTGWLPREDGERRSGSGGPRGQQQRVDPAGELPDGYGGGLGASGMDDIPFAPVGDVG